MPDGAAGIGRFAQSLALAALRRNLIIHIAMNMRCVGVARGLGQNGFKQMMMTILHRLCAGGGETAMVKAIAMRQVNTATGKITTEDIFINHELGEVVENPASRFLHTRLEGVAEGINSGDKEFRVVGRKCLNQTNGHIGPGIGYVLDGRFNKIVTVILQGACSICEIGKRSLGMRGAEMLFTDGCGSTRQIFSAGGYRSVGGKGDITARHESLPVIRWRRQACGRGQFNRSFVNSSTSLNCLKNTAKQALWSFIMANVFRDFLSAVESAAAPLNPQGQRLAVELPRDPSHGDWTTNAAMVLAKAVGKPPRAVAEELLPRLKALPDVVSVEIAGPGFINVRMSPVFWQKQVGVINTTGTAYGTSDMGGQVGCNVEYVSANPTGPMHTAHARNACFGDALANLLVKAGYKVTREFYINDAGNQVDILARSTYLRYTEALGDTVTIPEGMYPGEYLKDVGAALAKRDGDKWKGKPEAEWLQPIKRFATDFLVEEIKSDLALLGVKMDVFTSERAMRESGAVEKCLKLLEGKGLVYKGVLEPPKGKVVDDWEPKEQTLFRSTQFGDDVDRPLIKADGNYTYFAPDIAYHLDKYQRSGPMLVTVVGADHGGWVKRIKAAVAAVSDGKAQFSVKLYALVNTFDNGVPVRMSKRAGTFVTLRDVVERVGKDVLRFVMLTRAPEMLIDFDFVKVVEQSKDNPVFYVQYAHARCKSVKKQAAAVGIDAAGANLSLLADPDELTLVKKLAEWPRLVEQAAIAQEPHRVAFYLQELAAAFHGLWHKGNDNASLRFVREDDKEVTKARLALVAAVATVIASGLEVLGVQPVEEMR